MDQVYVCTQCGEESDAPGSCQICGLALVPLQDDDSSDDNVNLSDDDLEDDAFADAEDNVSLEEEVEEEEDEEAPYDSYDDQDNA